MSENQNSTENVISDEDQKKFRDAMEQLTKEMEENPILTQYDMTFPITINNIITKISPVRPNFRGMQPGTLVKIRPCAEECNGKTYLGIYLGDLIAGILYAVRTKTQELEILSTDNPAIFVPDLKKIVWGMESWWGQIKTMDEVKDITDDDIENVWYVKLLKSQLENQK